MNESSNPNWTPDPQLLAAYFDGELEGRADIADMRARIEAWLEAHPDAVEDWQKHRELQKLWLDTTPAEPTAATWNQVLDQIDGKRRLGEPGAAATGVSWRGLGILAASVALFVGILFATDYFNGPVVTPAPPFVFQPRPLNPANVEVFEVALQSEITIHWIDGADTRAIVVGEMPLHEAMTLVDAGEIRVVSCCPKTNIRQDGPHRPMVWARLD